MLVDLLRLSDEYRQCLILDKTQAESPRDTFFADGGTSAENLNFLLSDRVDRLLKHLILTGKSDDLIEAIRRVAYDKVDEAQCKDFDPYYDPVLEKVIDLEKAVGIAAKGGQKRWRSQHSRR